MITPFRKTISIVTLRPFILSLTDTEWPFTYTDHDREIVRAIVVDDEGYYYFCRANRDDDFGRSVLIETSGGGVEPGEDFLTAIRRELHEELGAEVEVLGEIGLVSDYYNLIHRHNLNHYYLCRTISFARFKTGSSRFAMRRPSREFRHLSYSATASS